MLAPDGLEPKLMPPLVGARISNPLVRVADCPFGLVTMTFQDPTDLLVIGNEQVNWVDPERLQVPNILVSPDFARITEGPAVEKPVPVITILLTVVLLYPYAGERGLLIVRAEVAAVRVAERGVL